MISEGIIVFFNEGIKYDLIHLIATVGFVDIKWIIIHYGKPAYFRQFDLLSGTLWKQGIT